MNKKKVSGRVDFVRLPFLYFRTLNIWYINPIMVE